MAEAKHTPWKTSGVRVRYDGQAWLQVIGETDGKQFQVALVPYGDRTPEEHREAHAHQQLVAAAPDLAQAGRELSDAIGSLAQHFNEPAIDHLERWQRLDAAQKAMRAVLAKLTGAAS